MTFPILFFLFSVVVKLKILTSIAHFRTWLDPDVVAIRVKLFYSMGSGRMENSKNGSKKERKIKLKNKNKKKTEEKKQAILFYFIFTAPQLLLFYVFALWVELGKRMAPLDSASL